MKLHAIILAAGKGSRMKSNIPKVLHPIASRPMLHRVLETANTLDPEQLNLVLGHGRDQIEQSLADSTKTVNVVLQAEQLGTGHAVSLAMDHIPDESISLVLYGDVPLITRQTLTRCVEAAQQQNLGVVTANVADPAELGRIVRDANGSIESIVEYKDATPQQRAINEINSGILAAPTALLRDWLKNLKTDNSQGEYYLTDVVAMAVADRVAVTGVVAENEHEVLGINDRVQLAQAERIVQRQQTQALMQQGVTFADPERVDIRGRLRCGIDCFIDVNTVFVGDVTLADEVIVGPGSVVQDSVIGSAVTIQANTIVEGAVVGDDCTLGPFARIRPGSNFAEGVKVGNFVETKKVELGAGVKASHLTYLGDASVGAETNIGAGTVTCNYDGVDKHRTEIGQNAFIGTNSTLVAPLEIGDGAFVAAGSTVTKDVDEETLAVGRARQRTITQWVSPTRRKQSPE
ncbi:MAG: bifunctional UDP-N-acetylglucosamine diphosphorylase/glucosamine-1-phosphate N-acetyltransferase GlmU [Gammaproteobacteria bacterium]